MKQLFFCICIFLGALTSAWGQASWDNKDTTISGSNLRTFQSTAVCESDYDWEWWKTGITGCGDGDSCTLDRKKGYNAAYDKTCCLNAYICREDGELLPQEEIEAIAAAIDSEGLEEVFQPSTTVYWGYHSSTNRSPNAGRGVATEAKLDACLGHGSVDYIKSLSAFQQLTTCRGSSYCGDSLKNQHCTSTMPNGETLCQDRCDCVFSGTCNSY